MKNIIKPELLSPAGTIESVSAAVQNGCTAVYIGAGNFNARRNAKAFSNDELENIIDYCQLRGVKLYAAANTLIKDKELQEFLEIVGTLYSMGADGIIVQDIGAAMLIKKYFPDFYLLASTQMTVHDAAGANLLYNNGFDRVILSRELSILEVAEICKKTNAEIECFVHGALCVCYSGQCLMSSFIGGRSGNRGMCAQPCRLSYSLFDEGGQIVKGNILSPKDIMGLNMLPSLINSGVKSFKIEGRMKSSEYVAGVTAIYRKYIDLYFENPNEYKVEQSDITKLEEIFNRSGFNEGYFNDYSGRHMLTDKKVGNTGVKIGKVNSYKRDVLRFKTIYDTVPGDGIEIYMGAGNGSVNPGAYITKKYKRGEFAEVRINGNHDIKEGSLIYRTYNKALMDSLSASYKSENRKMNINGSFTARLGEEITFAVSVQGLDVVVRGSIADKASSSPMSCEKAREQLLKTGATSFKLESLEMDMDKDLFISIGELNALRRTALEQLSKKVIESGKRKKEHFQLNYVLNKEEKIKKQRFLTVLCRSEEQLKALSEFNFDRVYIDFESGNICESIDRLRRNKTEIFKCLPRIERDGDCIDFSAKDEFDGYLIRTYGQALRLINENILFSVDYTLNTFNAESAAYWGRVGANSICISPELGFSEMGSMPHNTELIVYGKITLMTTVQCPIGNFAADKNEKQFCSNRKSGKAFCIGSNRTSETNELMTCCDYCYCLVLDSQPINLGKKAYDAGLLNHGINRIELSNEGYVDTKNIMSTYTDFNGSNFQKNGIGYAGRYFNEVK